MADDPGRPEAKSAEPQRTTPDDQPAQTMSLSTAQAAQQLGVDPRTVRRYIVDGIRAPGGGIIRLQARQVQTGRGQEYQVYQHDLEAFKAARDRAATEGQAAGQLARVAAEESQALTTLNTSLNVLATELERRTTALLAAQETIERLAREAGQHAGRAQELERRNQELERERDALRQQVIELEQAQRDYQQKAQELEKKPRRVRLLPWQQG